MQSLSVLPISEEKSRFLWSCYTVISNKLFLCMCLCVQVQVRVYAYVHVHVCTCVCGARWPEVKFRCHSLGAVHIIGVCLVLVCICMCIYMCVHVHMHVYVWHMCACMCTYMCRHVGQKLMSGVFLDFSPYFPSQGHTLKSFTFRIF